MASGFLSGMLCTSRALLSRSIASRHISNHAVVVSLVPTTLACSSTSRCLSFRLTLLQTALYLKKSLGRSAPLSTLHYIQPGSAPELYPSELSPSSNTVSKSPVLIEDDQLASNFRPADCRLDGPPLASSPLDPLPPLVLSSSPSHSITVPTPKPPVLLSTMSPEEVTWLLHHPNTSLPDIRPCDTANASDTKVHWMSEQIHRIMGCQKFCNYKHILQSQQRW